MQENIYGHKKKLEFILKAIQNYSKIKSIELFNIKVLDFGCGNATAVSYPVANLGVIITGIDIHSESIKFATKNNRFPKAKFILGNEDTILKVGGCFDIIIYSDVIEHLPDPKSTIKKIRSMHEEGGIIIGAIPNGYGPFELEKFITKWTGLEWGAIKITGLASKIKRKIDKKEDRKMDKMPYNMECKHSQFFRLSDFYKLMQKTGYNPLQFRNGAFLGAPISEIFLRFKKFIEWNVRIADKLPPQLVSTWYFVCKKIS